MSAESNGRLCVGDDVIVREQYVSALLKRHCHIDEIGVIVQVDNDVVPYLVQFPSGEKIWCCAEEVAPCGHRPKSLVFSFESIMEARNE